MPPAPAAHPAWRQFSFFDVVPVKDVHDPATAPDIFKSTPEISTIINSSAGLLIADIHGSIHILDRQFESFQSWVAHVGGRVTHMVERNGTLVTLGEEDSVRSPLLKIWDLNSKEKKTGGPLLLRSTKIQPNNRPHPVSTVALSANLSQLAIGFADGSVILYRHLDQSLASSGPLTTLPKPRTVHENPLEPITGLGFREVAEEQHITLFIVTTNRVLMHTGRGNSGSTVVDEVGAGLGCATIDSYAKDIVIARDEAIYICGTDGRGACYAYEGQKLSIHTHQSYLIIVSPPFIPFASSASATVRNYVARTVNPSDADITKVTIFDPENKLVAYTGTFKNGVREVFSSWGHIYVLSNTGEISWLQEKATSSKLEMLYSQSLYILALNLAKTQGLDAASVADIHRQYGDHQYSKGNYDGAMQQYVQTIGQLQPSYVIRKYLDAQRIHNLVTYLQELHSLGLANSDHTTLLLNTYTKLKDVSRLDSFIKTESRRDASDGELPFDLETAIRVCRQAGYFDHASYLAKKYERHEDYLRIQIEDSGKYAEALSYLRKLGPEAAETNLARYGRAMLANLPDDTTQLLIDLCTAPGTLVVTSDEAPSSARANHPSYLSYLALNRNSIVAQSDAATTIAPSIKTVRPGEAPSVRNSVHEDLASISPPPSAITPRIPRPPIIKRPSPRIYFAHFVDHLEQFVVFLETVALRRWGQSLGDQQPEMPPLPAEGPDEQVEEKDQVAVWNTLLELYLTLPETETKSNPPIREKALRLLKSTNVPYDTTHALILCSSHEYTQGLVLLWEKMAMYGDILRFWMDRENEGSAGASAQVVKHLKVYGSKEPSLYPLVLRFLTSSPELLSRHQEDVKDILAHIDKEDILPPLGVIQVLSRNGVASVGLVREWLMLRIKQARKDIETDKEWISSYRVETEAKLKNVAELADPAHPKVFHVTRCSTCSGQLDLPSVHFMCNHSYHQRCLLGQEAECPLCAQEAGVIQEIRRNNERMADQHDIFLSEVKENGFKAVAEAFGRGALNYSTLEDVPR